MKRQSMGIMTTPYPPSPPFAEKNNFRLLCLAGERMGIEVFVFFPRDVDFHSRAMNGYIYQPATASWIKRRFPFPSFIYDRFFYTGRESVHTRRVIQSLKKDPHIRFLGIGLAGKWQTYRLLSQHQQLSRFVPPSEMVTSPATVKDWLEKYRDIVLKPVGGSLGRGIIRIRFKDHGLLLYGRNMRNRPIKHFFSDYRSCQSYLKQHHLNRQTLVQPYLSLSTPDGEPFDIRVLIQKNENGVWSRTGMAIRKGNPDSLTSNLHGGGRTYEVEPFLRKYFSEQQIQRIFEEVSILTEQAPPYLESCHGPLVELGMDVGVDRKGKVWLIELNSKPGRKIFYELKEPILRKQSVLNPILYARHMMQSESNSGG